MRAAVLRAYGGPPAYATDHPDPGGDTVIRVTAAPIAPLDLLVASGTSYFGRPAMPYVPGVQGVGQVVRSAEHGEGTRVWFATSAGMAPGDGGLAELCAVRPTDVVPITAALADEQAAAIGTSGIAGWLALIWRAALRPGERVVVLGASGAVGQVALAAAKDRGAGRVVAVCRSEAAGERALDGGADEVVLSHADLDRAALTAQLVDAAGGPVDIVIVPTFGEPAAAAALALGPGGRLVNLGGAAGDLTEFSSAALRGRMISVLGYTNNAITPDQRRDALDNVFALAAGGALDVAHEVHPLDDCAAAWEDAGRTRMVLVP